jgi:hypothetical protein
METTSTALSLPINATVEVIKTDYWIEIRAESLI